MKDSNTQFQLLRDDLIIGQIVSLPLGYSWTVSRTIKATIKKLMEQIEWDVDHISF